MLLPPLVGGPLLTARWCWDSDGGGGLAARPNGSTGPW